MGFKEADDPLNKQGGLAEKPAVYALTVDKQIGRLRGKTDIIYIGQTGNLRKRMSEYGGK